MEINLSSVGMEKGRQYETVITTLSPEGKRNAAPIGVICTGKDSIICRIFKGSTTLENIISQKEFTVNITENPELLHFQQLITFQKLILMKTIPLKILKAISNVKLLT